MVLGGGYSGSLSPLRDRARVCPATFLVPSCAQKGHFSLFSLTRASSPPATELVGPLVPLRNQPSYFLCSDMKLTHREFTTPKHTCPGQSALGLQAHSQDPTLQQDTAQEVAGRWLCSALGGRFMGWGEATPLLPPTGAATQAGPLPALWCCWVFQ